MAYKLSRGANKMSECYCEILEVFSNLLVSVVSLMLAGSEFQCQSLCRNHVFIAYMYCKMLSFQCSYFFNIFFIHLTHISYHIVLLYYIANFAKVCRKCRKLLTVKYPSMVFQVPSIYILTK